MFTTGSKLFIGASALALAGTLIYSATQDSGAIGTLGLVSATIVLVFLMGINFWVRDSNVSSMDTPGIVACSAAHPAPGRSMWPMVAGLGSALVPVGLIVGKAITWIAVIVLMIATVEWMVQSWSERASSDAAYNAGIRKRILHPMELPVLGAIGLGMMIFSFSRIMLHLPSAAGAIVFGGIAATVLLFGALIAAKRQVGRSLVATLCAIGAVGLIGAGVASAVAGGRHIAKHELAQRTDSVDNCTGNESEADSHSSRAIAGKANLAGLIVLQGDKLYAEVIGINGRQDTLTLPRSTDSFFEFKNLDSGKRRLVADLGHEVVDPGTDKERKVPLILCTQAVGEGGKQFIVIKPPRPTSADQQYFFEVPGIDSKLKIEVP